MVQFGHIYYLSMALIFRDFLPTDTGGKLVLR